MISILIDIKEGLKLRKLDDLERIIRFDDIKSIISNIEKNKN